MSETFRRGVPVLCLLLAALSPGNARAETKYDLETGREIGLTAAGALLYGLGVWADQGTHPLNPEEIDALDPSLISRFDRGATHQWSPDSATASDVLVGVTLVAPLGLFLTDAGKAQAGKLTVIYGETLLLSVGTTHLLKALTTRTRPFVYNDNPDIPLETKMSHSACHSFPSGHTANAFAAAVFLGTVHDRLYPDSGAGPWVWAGGLAAASTVGILRYKAGRHYPTDILAGAAIGTLCGWLVPKLHEVEPGDTPAGFDAGPMLSYGFRF